MDWVPDLIGNPPRREENGGYQTQKTIGVEKRRIVEQSEIETEIAVEIESKTQSCFEIENCKTGETEIDCKAGETEIVQLQIGELESESP